MATNSEYIFNYLSDVWDLLPEADRQKFAETWKAYEKSYGSIWTSIFEQTLGVHIDSVPLYNSKRWLQHRFDDSTEVERAATFTSAQDLSQGINLSNRFLIKLSVDGGPAIEIDLRGVNPLKTTLAEIVSRINQQVGQPVASAVQQNQLLQLTSTTKGPGSAFTFYPASISANDASAIVLGLDPDFDLPKTLPTFRYEFLLGDKFITKIPVLQDRVHTEQATVTLYEAQHFEIEFGTGVIAFASPPPALMWARDTFVNLETPYNNFGYLLDLYDKNTPSYLKAVKGLWYAFWTGPRPENIRRSLYLLFGLPTATERGTVMMVTDTQITIQYFNGITETFNIPSELVPLVVPGQAVTQFEPLVDGIAVYDKVNYPGFLRREVGRPGVQPFLTDKASKGVDPSTDESKALRILEENTYLPQINVNTFISPDIKLSNVKTFLTNIQPKSRSFLFQVLVGTFREKLAILDEGYTTNPTGQFPNGQPSLGLGINFDVTPNVDWNLNTSADQTSLDEVEAADYTYQVLDSEGLAALDKVEVEVRSFAVLTDSFVLEG